MDLTCQADQKANSDDLGVAQAFLVQIRGSGRLFAVTAEALRAWVSGAVPIGAALRALDGRGVLIRGADGKFTRQFAFRDWVADGTIA